MTKRNLTAKQNRDLRELAIDCLPGYEESFKSIVKNNKINDGTILRGMQFIGLCGLLGLAIGTIRNELADRKSEAAVREYFAVPRDVKMNIEYTQGQKVSVYEYNGRSYTMNFDKATNTVTLTPYEQSK